MTSGSRVLLIDDDQVEALILERELAQQGSKIELIYAASAESVLERARQDDQELLGIELILLDLSLPGLDGFAFLRMRQEIPHLARVPVIMMTGSDQIDDISQAFELGVCDYFVKSARQGQYELLVRKMQHHLPAEA